MSDSLRDRIAAVIDAHTYGTNKRAYEVADAVIAALGLSEQTHCDECANHRYVTEWENDD